MAKKPSTTSIRRGALAYLLRNLGVNATAVFTNLWLLKILSPAEFGIIASLNVILSLCTILSDSGLNAYLLKNRENLTDAKLQSFFGVQLRIYVVLQGVTFAAVGVAFITQQFLTFALLATISVLSIAPVLLRANAVMLLERDLNFTAIAKIEILESFTQSFAMLLLAFVGAGVWAMVGAVLLKSLVSLFLIRKHIKPASAFGRWQSHSQLGEGVKFGLYYNASILLGTLRSAANPVITGKILGASAIGFCDRAAFIAGLPLLIVGTVQSRILFPYFCSIEIKTEELIKAYNRTLFWSSCLDKYFFVALAISVPSLGLIIGPKWASITPLLDILLLGNAIFGAWSSSAVPLLNSIGKVSILGLISVCTTLAAWISSGPLLSHFGLIGFGLISILNWLPTIILLFVIRSKFPGIRNFGSVLPSWIGLLTSCYIIRVHGGMYIKTITDLGIAVLLGICIYTLVVAVVGWKEIKFELKIYKHTKSNIELH